MTRTALISGMGPGFGEKLAWRLAEAGYGVALFARSADYLEEQAAALRAEGHEALAIPTDVTDPEVVVGGFETIRAELGPVDAMSVQVSQEAGWARLDQTVPETPGHRRAVRRAPRTGRRGRSSHCRNIEPNPSHGTRDRYLPADTRRGFPVAIRLGTESNRGEPRRTATRAGHTDGCSPLPVFADSETGNDR